MRKEITLKLLSTLREQYPYAILHHIDTIFDEKSDIDLIIDCNKSQINHFIKSFCEENHCFFVSHTIDLGAIRYNVIFYFDTKFFKIELDITFSNNNILEINVQELINRKEEVLLDGNSISKISNQDEFFFYIKKKAFKTQNILSHYKYLKEISPDTTKNQVLTEYNKNKKNFKTLKYQMFYWIQKIKLLFIRIYENPSFTISLLGPDGSGKSTIINELKNNNPFINFKYFHLKPVNPKQESIKQKVEDDPHKEKEYSQFISIVKILFLVIQYNLGWVKNILTIKYTPTLIVFDRYFDDILADPKRYRYGSSLKIVKFCFKFIPKPKITFILHSTPSIIHFRKKEVSFKELKNQLNRYSKLSKSNKRYHLVEVNEPVKKIVKKITLTLLTAKKNV